VRFGSLRRHPSGALLVVQLLGVLLYPLRTPAPRGPSFGTFGVLFLSFTALSGVGLGDVLPISARARALVMLEEFAGVMCIALVVSRLIGLTIVRAERP
jgi:hypothetical protein